MTTKFTSCIFTGQALEAKLETVNSLAPGRSGFNFKSAIFNLVLLIGIFRSSYDNALRWMSWDLSADKSTLVQVMAWCRQAPSHYLSQCWPRSISPYGISRLQWVNLSFDPHAIFSGGEIHITRSHCNQSFQLNVKILFFIWQDFYRCRWLYVKKHIPLQSRTCFCCTNLLTYRWLSGKLWYLQHNFVGGTLVYHYRMVYSVCTSKY